MVIGGGFQFSRFLVEGRYTEGLTNIVKELEQDYKNRSFAVMIGVQFR